MKLCGMLPNSRISFPQQTVSLRRSQQTWQRALLKSVLAGSAIAETSTEMNQQINFEGNLQAVNKHM